MRMNSLPRSVLLALMMIVTLTSLPMLAADRDAKSSGEALIETLRRAFAAGGETALREVATANRKKITGELILRLADTGVKERDDGSLVIARVLAATKDDAKTTADVFFRSGDYCYLTSNFASARGFLEQAEAIYTKLNDLSGLGSTKKRTADICSRTGENDKARQLLDEAQSLFERAGDRKGQGGVCLSQWYAAFVAGDFKTARHSLDKALGLFTACQDPLGVAATYRSMGFTHYMTGENKAAFECYEKSLSLYAKLDDPFGQGNVLRGMGDVCIRLGENEKALELNAQALPFLEKITDLRGQAYIYGSLCEIWERRGDLQKAMEMSAKALPLFEKAGDLTGQAQSHNRAGVLLMHSGDNDRALAELAEAQSLSIKAGDLYGQANALVDVAAVEATIGDIPKALSRLLEAQPIYQKVEDPVGEGNVHFQIGDIYLATGDLERARSHYLEAMPFFEKADASPDQGNVHLRIGDIHFRRREYAEAAAELVLALALYEKAEDPMGKAYVLFRQAIVWIKQDEDAKASNALDNALPLFVQTREAEGEADVCGARGEIALRAREYEKAQEWASKAEQLYRRIGDPALEKGALFLKARILKEKGQKDEAAGLYLRGLTLVENLRRSAGLPDMKQSFMESALDAYEEAAGFFLQNGYEELAFRTAESMKARAFLDMLTEGLVDLDRDVPPDLKKRRDELENSRSMLRTRLQEERRREQPDDAGITSVESEIERTEAMMDGLRREIRLKNPQYAAVRYPDPVGVRTLRESTLRDDEVILEYQLLEDAPYCFVVSKSAFTAVKLPAATEALERQVKSWLLQMQRPEDPIQQKSAELLGGILVGPLAKHIRGKRLIIVPDGVLARLPFEALREGGKYLVEKYSIAYVQSASVLETLRTRYGREGTTARFVGFGDPVYDYEDFKAGRPEKGGDLKGAGQDWSVRGGYLKLGGRLDRIEGSGREVGAISTLFQKRGMEEHSYMRLEASEGNAKGEEIGKADFIHFSAHGVLTERLQAIALSQIPGDAEDGFLTLGEIMNCRYAAQLVVLSACETGLGKSERGEGIVGLTRAVMYAGSPAAVVSLWSVSDVGTEELMTRFYSHLLRGGLSKSDALRMAKLDLLGQRAYKHPFFWAAFVMYGD